MSRSASATTTPGRPTPAGHGISSDTWAAAAQPSSPSRTSTRTETHGSRRSPAGRQLRRRALDREVALLRRILNYAVRCGDLSRNPLDGVQLLRKPNIRRVVISEETFQKLLHASESVFRPILLVAYDHGLRKGEILGLRWEQLDVREGVIRLAPQDTKGGEHRVVYLTSRTLEALRALPRRLHAEHVFTNPATGERWWEIRKMFRRACRNAGLENIWFHDLRRSFVTNARRRGVPESVVMKLSGHRTRSVFDRYNVVSEDDLRSAVRQIESGAAAELARVSGHVLDTVGSGAPTSPSLPPPNVAGNLGN